MPIEEYRPGTGNRHLFRPKKSEKAFTDIVQVPSFPCPVWSSLSYWDTEYARHLLNVVASSDYTEPFTSYMFDSLRKTSYANTEVVIIANKVHTHSNGLCMSLKPGYRKTNRPHVSEGVTKLGLRKPTTHDLSGWAHNGVLLLPTRWVRYADGTAYKNAPQSLIDMMADANRMLSYSVIRLLSLYRERLVFVVFDHLERDDYLKCWIDTDKHLLLSVSSDDDPSIWMRQVCKYLGRTPEQLWRLP